MDIKRGFHCSDEMQLSLDDIFCLLRGDAVGVDRAIITTLDKQDLDIAGGLLEFLLIDATFANMNPIKDKETRQCQAET